MSRWPRNQTGVLPGRDRTPVALLGLRDLRAGRQMACVVADEGRRIPVTEQAGQVGTGVDATYKDFAECDECRQVAVVVHGLPQHRLCLVELSGRNEKSCECESRPGMSGRERTPQHGFGVRERAAPSEQISYPVGEIRRGLLVSCIESLLEQGTGGVEVAGRMPNGSQVRRRARGDAPVVPDLQGTRVPRLRGRRILGLSQNAEVKRRHRHPGVGTVFDRVLVVRSRTVQIAVALCRLPESDRCRSRHMGVA